MKNIINRIGFFLIIVSISSCSDDFLEEVTKGSVSENAYWTSESDAVSGLRGAYYQVGTSFSGYSVWQYVVDDLGVDSGVGGWFASEQYSNYSDWSSTTPDFTDWGIWGAMWEMINKTNQVLDRTPAINMDEAAKARILGEAHGLRAFGYFTMLNWFGPMAEVTTNNDLRFEIPRGTVESNYALIESDLLSAIASLPLKSELIAMGELEHGRLSKGAAQGLLVKVYTEQSKWQEAADLAGEIISSDEYQLEPNYLDVFDLGNQGYDNKEVLWPLVFTSPSIADPVQSQIFFVYTYKASEDTSFAHFNDWGGTARATTDFYNSFEAGDVRREGLFYSTADQSWLTDPVMLTKHPADPTSNGIDSGNDFAFIRYADVLLMRAEALNKLGDLSGAVIEINKVRSRAALGDLVFTNFDQPALHNQIFNERRWELYFEGHGKRDMKRMQYDRLLDHIKSESSDWQTKGAERYLLLPIPAGALSANPLLTQNPGF